MACEELCHDRFQILDLNPDFCNLFQEDQLNESVGGQNMPQEHQFITQPSHNLSRRSIMVCVYESWLLYPTGAKCFQNGNHTMDNGDNLVSTAGYENKYETENHSLHSERPYNNIILPSEKLHLNDLDVSHPH